MSAIVNNSKGISGIDPSSKILPIRIISKSAFASDDDLAEAINFDSVQEAKILKMCIGFTAPVSDKIQSAIDIVSPTSLLVASAGNRGLTSSLLFPAIYST